MKFGSPILAVLGFLGEDVTQLEKTVQLISELVAQKESNLAQLNEWKKQGSVRQVWENAATTIQMKELAETFKLPAMQERMNNVYQSQTAQDSHTDLNPGEQSQQLNQQTGRGRGR